MGGGLSSWSYGFSSSHVWMWELNHKESWLLKNWCFWTLVLKTLGSLLNCKEIKLVNLKRNQFWICIGRTDAEAEAPILWPPILKNWLIREDHDARKDWRQEETGMPEDGMVGWHHRLNGHEFKQVLGDSEGQGNLACCSPWSCKEMDRTEWLNNNLIIKSFKSRVFSGWWQKWKWKWERERVRIYITAADSKGRVGHVRRNTSHLQEWRVASSSQLNKKTKTKTNQQKRQLRFTASSNRILLTI